MSEIRKRVPGEQNNVPEPEPTTTETGEEEDELPASPDLKEMSALPQGSDKTTEVLDTALKDLTPRWRNWVIRGIFSWLMILGFCLVLYFGPLALVLLIMIIQIKCFHEIITIGYTVYKSYELPWFRTLSWYFLFASNYFFYGESMMDTFGLLLRRTEFAAPFVTYHRSLRSRCMWLALWGLSSA
ncbi:hypothetical protein ScPMuIL_004935 [Solemya velum]